MKDNNEQQPKNKKSAKRLPPSHYYHNPKLQKKRLSDAKEMVLYMVPRCLSDDEFYNLSNLTKDPVWCDERALTSHIAQTKLKVGFFHSRRPNIIPTLEKKNLPFRLVQISHPDGICELYFLVFTGDGTPPSLQEVKRLLDPSMNNCQDNLKDNDSTL